MRILDQEAYTYDDVLLLPQYSEIESRNNVDISTKVGNIHLDIPIISANMRSITGYEMAISMAKNGGLGILHRWGDECISNYNKTSRLVAAVPSVGVGSQQMELAKAYYGFGARTICLDIAHGDSSNGRKHTEILKKMGFVVISGNVATPEGTIGLINSGADVVKVGVGPGSVCTTRMVTGHGYPQFSAVIACAGAAWSLGKQIIADGGMKNSGDIVKALAAGACAVMTGSLFAGCLECEDRRNYYGMASSKNETKATPEGVHREVQLQKKSVYDTLTTLAGGIRSGCSYSGAKNLEELQENALFVKVSSNTVLENSPHYGKTDIVD